MDRPKTFLIACACVLFLTSSPAGAESFLTDRFEAGWGRMEAGFMAGVSNGEGDFYATAAAAYEYPIANRAVLGLKAIPLFLYFEDDSDAIYGAGLGAETRIFLQEDKGYAGLFVQAGITMLWQADYMEDNGSRVNFATAIGAGYEFGNHISVALKFEHISNAGLDEPNAGANGLGIVIGRRF